MNAQPITRSHNLVALLKYNLSGAVALLTDVSLLYIFVELGLPQLPAVVLSVCAAGSIHYIICRYYVFRSFSRSFFTGALYFASIIGISLILNIGLYLLLIEILPLHFTIVRAISIGLVGILSFVLNAHYNFGTLTLKAN